MSATADNSGPACCAAPDLRGGRCGHTSPTSPSDRLTLACILIAAALLRMWLASQTVMVSRDTVAFIWYAQALADHPLTTLREHPQHPLYPALLLGARQAFAAMPGLDRWADDPVAGWTIPAVGVSLIGGLGVVLAVWRLTGLLFGRRAATIAAALAAMTAEFCQLSADGLTDMPHLALYLWAAATGVRGVQARCWYSLGLCGVLSGLAFLTRPEGAEVAVATAGLLLFRPAEWPMRRRLAAALVVGLAALAVASPYMLVTGKLVQKKAVGKLVASSGERPSRPPHVQAAGIQNTEYRVQNQTSRRVDPAGSLAARTPTADQGTGSIDYESKIQNAKSKMATDVGSPVPTQIGRAGVGTAFTLIGENYARSLRVTFLLPALAYALLRRRINGDRFGCTLVGVLFVLHLLVLLGLLHRFDYWRMFSLRHVMVMAGLTLPFSAAVLAAGAAWVASIHPRRTILAALSAAAVLIGPTLPWMLEPHNATDAYYLRAAQWMRQHSRRGADVLTTRHELAFYAAGRYIPALPGIQPTQLLGLIRQTRPEWVALDERRMNRVQVGYLARLQAALEPGEALAAVHDEPAEGESKDHRVVILQYTPPPERPASSAS